MLTVDEIKKLEGRYPAGTEVNVTMNWPHKQQFDKRFENAGEEKVETRPCVIDQTTENMAVIVTLPRTDSSIRTTVTWVDVATGDAVLELINE